jgi:hypothetical protein
MNIAEKLISNSLADLEQLRDYERQVTSPAVDDPRVELELLQSIWHLYAQWASEAVEVFQRARSLKSDETVATTTAQLNDAIGHVQARLSVKPEQIMRAKEQARQGQFIPAKELRDELNARLRA